MAAFHFYLDKPFRKGVNHLTVKTLIKGDGNYFKFLNPLDNSIYAWLSFDGGKYLKVRTTEKVEPKNWDFKLKRAKKSMAGSAQLNERLDKIKSDVLKNYRELILFNPNASLEEIKTSMKNSVHGSVPTFNRPTFLERYDEYLSDKKNEIKHYTYRKLASFKNVFEEYLEWAEIKPNHFYLESITDKWDTSFKNYLFEERELVNNTASKYYEIVKTFLRYWKRKGVFKQVSGDFETYSIKRDHKDIIYLTHFEINKLVNLDLSKERSLQKVRDCFAFQIFTGQRFSDLKALKSTDILLNVDGTMDWHLHQVKGNKSKKVIIPLLPEAMAIVRKYGLLEKGILPKKLPVLCNPLMNKRVKTICQRADINQTVTIVRYCRKKRVELTGPKWSFISTHAARRSFISNCLEKSIPMHLVMELSGHTNSRVIKNSYQGLSLSHLRSTFFTAWSTNEKSDEKGNSERLQNS